MVTYIYAQLCVVKQIQVLRFLKMMSVKFLSMDFILLTWYKFGFCEMIFKRGTLQKSGREVLREGIFENKKYYFPYKLYHSLRFIISRFIVLNLFPRTRQFVDTYLSPASTSLALRQLQYSIVFICLYFIGLMYFICTPKFTNTLRTL